MTRRVTTDAARRALAGLVAVALIMLMLVMAAPAALDIDPSLRPFPDQSGAVLTVSPTRTVDLTNPFFQDIGANGRTCATCHRPEDAWSITPGHVQQRFDKDGGLEPLFRPTDGAVCPNQDVSSVESRRAAYRLLLARALIRVSMTMPPDAEFDLVAIDDPYGCSTPTELSVYRRPLPSTNLRFLTTVMWDGRESTGPALDQNLMTQAKDATLKHAEASVAPSDVQAAGIVAFEMTLSTAQSHDALAGSLSARRAIGGPDHLVGQEFFAGINDPRGLNPTGRPFDARAFMLFAPWADAAADPIRPILPAGTSDAPPIRTTAPRAYIGARQAIARGEEIFNLRPMTLQDVGGLNDTSGKASIQATCTTCHDSPNVGNHSVPGPLNLGPSDASRRPADLPLFTLAHRTTHAVVQTTDPGRALVTGKWADIGKFKTPILRGLAARPPYFHGGSAATLADVVDFYNDRFQLMLTAQEKADLVAFLRAL